MIVGITGYARSGKDTVADMLLDYYGRDSSEKISLAASLKDFVNEIFGWGQDHREGYLKETDCYVTFCKIHLINTVEKYFGKLLERPQELITLSGKLEHIFHDHASMFKIKGAKTVEMVISPRKAYQVVGTEWAREFFGASVWIDLLEGKRDPSKVTIVPDIRFENEVDWIKDNKHTLVGVTRENRENIGTTHPSEQYIDTAIERADYIIYNNKDLSYLAGCVDGICKVL